MKKTLRTFCILLFMLLFLSGAAYAQYFYGVTDPGSERWMSISGEHYQVIYPVGKDSLARAALASLEALSPDSFEGSGRVPGKKPFPVVLHPYYVQSNGTVVWAPKRMELNTLAPTGGYPQLWLDQLALHESRHVAQMRSLERGFISFMGVLAGEQATGIAAGLYTPKWFLEGDAVVAETENSNSGRGRQASFLAYYRASLLQGRTRSWNRWRFGSFKDYTPDHYALGYLLNTTARMKTNNPNLGWDVTRVMVRNFWNPLVRDVAFRKVTGYTPRELMRESERLYTEMWREELEERAPADKAEPIASAGSGDGWYSEFVSLVAANDTTFYLQQRSAKENAKLIKIVLGRDGGVTRTELATQSSGIMENLVYADSTLYWNEVEFHPRWSGAAYANLFSLNIATGESSRITRRSYLDNPDAASAPSCIAGHSGTLLTAVELFPTGESGATLLSADGERLRIIKAPSGMEMKEAALLGDSLYCTMVSKEGIGLYSTHVEESGWRCLIEPQHASMSKITITELPFSHKERLERVICFVSDASGVSGIYGVSLESGIVKQLYASAYGCSNPNIAGGRIFMTEMTLTGADLVAFTPDAPSAPGLYRRLPEEYKYQMAETLASQVEARRDVAGASAESAAGDSTAGMQALAEAPSSASSAAPVAKRYRKGAHLFNFHSWAPLWVDPDRLLSLSYDHFYEMVAPGATLFSQNRLGTATTVVGYSWHRGNSPVKSSLHAGHLRFRYSGLYPVLELSADVNSEEHFRTTLVRDEEKKSFVGHREYLKSPFVKVEGRAYIPLTFSYGGWVRGIIPQLSYKIENNRYNRISNGAPTADYASFDQLKYILQLYIMRPTATAAIYPRLGAGLLATYGHSLSGSSTFAPIGLIHSYFYLPGAYKTHSIRLDMDFQRLFAGGKTYLVDNIMTFPRGYSDDYIPKEIFKVGASYAIPVHPGDLDLGFFAYIKRLQIIPFADFARYRAFDRSSGTLFSFGADAIVEGHFFRIGAPVQIGLRYARTGDDVVSNGRRNYFALLFNIDFGN